MQYQNLMMWFLLELTAHPYFYIQQKFIYKGELMATGLVKIRFLKRTGGTVSAKEVIDLVQDHQLPDLSSELGQEWFGLESKYLV